MKKLVETVENFCTWSGLELNTSKSEITSFDYRLKREIPGNDNVVFQGKAFKQLPPTEPFKYLGYRISLWKKGRRLNICPFTWGEKKYIFERTKDLANRIASTCYTPAQKHYLAKVGIINTFQYSAILTGWSWEELKRLDKLWIRAIKGAWGLSKSTGNGIFVLPAHRGGLQLSSPIPILGRAALAFLQKEWNKQGSDIQSILNDRLITWGRSWGCLSLLELQRECKGRISEKHILRGPEKLAIYLAIQLETKISWTALDQH
eukprot:3867316-Rhodomonas_salina.1